MNSKYKKKLESAKSIVKKHGPYVATLGLVFVSAYFATDSVLLRRRMAEQKAKRAKQNEGVYQRIKIMQEEYDHMLKFPDLAFEYMERDKTKSFLVSLIDYIPTEDESE